MPKPNCTEEIDVGPLDFGQLGRRVVEGRFDGGSMTSDGGVMLLGQDVALQGTELATAQVDTLRIKLLKVAAVVTRNTRRIRLYLASNWPSAQTFAHAMGQLRSP